jgi:hypothetical protein
MCVCLNAYRNVSQYKIYQKIKIYFIVLNKFVTPIKLKSLARESFPNCQYERIEENMLDVTDDMHM